MKKRHRGANEGSIMRRKDGRWQARISLGYENGKRKRRSFYGDSRQEVARLLTQALRSRDEGIPVPAGGLTVEKYLRRWLVEVESSVRPRTWQQFEIIVRRHLIPDLGKTKLEKLTPADVQQVLNRKLNYGLAPQSVRHIRTILGIALRSAVNRELIGRNAASLTHAPKVERKPIRTLTKEDAQTLLQSLSGHRLEALYVMALNLALRRGELLGLRWNDVDLDKRELRVAQSLQRVGGRLQLLPLKTESSARSIKLPEQVVSALKRRRIHQKEEQLAVGPEWKGNVHNLVFSSIVGTPVEPRNINQQFKRLLARAGLAQVRFHDLRHSCATLLLNDSRNPKQVQALLGHSRVSTTLDIYTHVDESMLNDTADRLERIFGKGTA